MLRASVLLLALLLASGRLLGQQSSPDRLPLAEQFRMHYFIDDSIVAALPGYVDFASDFPCNIVVYLMNPRTWGDSARALFRNALPADTSELSQAYCAGRPEVRVRASRYTRAELTAFANRITTVLQEPAIKVRGSIRVTPETLIVGAHNQAALKRARIRLAREKKLPQAMLSFRVWKPEEVDGPVTPPRAAYLAVLDAIAAAPSERGRPFIIDARSLPATVTEDDLRRRGLRSQSPSDSCDTATVVSFRPARQFVDGRYSFFLGWRFNDYSYEVHCPSGVCRVRYTAQLPGDKIATGCASAEFGVPAQEAWSPLGTWQLRLWVTGPAAKSAGPREVSGPIELRRASTGPVPRGLQWVYSVTYDSTLYAMLGAPRAGPAQAVLTLPDSVKLAFNPFVDHGTFRLTGVARGDSIVGEWHRTNFADDGYRGAFTMVRQRQ